MKIFFVVPMLVAACAAQRGYSSLDEEIFSVENIQPFARARFVRQGYGSAGGGGHDAVIIAPQRPAAQTYGPSYGSGGGPAYGTNGPVSFGSGGHNQGYNRPVGGGYSGSGVQPHRNPHQLGGGGGGYAKPQRPVTSGGYGGPSLPITQGKPIQSGYNAPAGGQGYGAPISKPISNTGYGGPSVKPQTGGPGYGPPAPVVETYKGDSYGNSGFGGPGIKPQTGGPGYGPPAPVVDTYSSPPIVQEGYGVPQKVPSGPVGYGR